MLKMFAALAVSALAVVSVSADSFFRVDFSALNKGKEANLTSPAAKNAIKLASWSWVKDAKVKARTLTGNCKVTDKEGWKTITFTVKADKDTIVNMSLCGEWAPKVAQMTRVYVTDIKMDGKLVSNGDLAQKAKNGTPAGFWMQKDAKYVPAAKKGDKNSVLVFHNGRIGRSFTLKAGKVYTFSVLVKAGKAAK